MLSARSATPHPPHHTVLSVDDNDGNRYIRARALRAAGFEVIDAADGTEALKLAAEKQPSLVLLDVRLPDLDGFDVCRRLKADPDTAAIPVIHISALGRFEEDMPQALENQSDVYLREPVEPATLVATVKALIRAREAERQQREAEGRAKEELRRAAELNRRMMQASTDCIAFLDLDSRLLFMNEGGLRRRDIDDFSQVGNASWLDLWKGSDYDAARAAVEVARAGQVGHFEGYSPSLKGIPKWWDVIVTPILGIDGKPDRLLAISREITERKRIEEALRETERRYSTLFANKINAVAHCRVITDSNGKPIDFEIVQVNAAYESITGIKKTDIEGKRAREVFPGIESFSFDYIGKYGKIALEGGELSFEAFFESTKQWLSIYIYSPNRGEFVAIFTDVSERKRTEQALRESEERYRTLFTTMIEGFAVGEPLFDKDGNPVDFQLIELNGAFERETGLSRDIIGRPVREALPNLEPFWIETYCRVALTREPAKFEQYNRDTKRHYSVFCYSPSQGRFAVLFRDITDTKRTEEALRAGEAQFRTLANAIPQLCWMAKADGWVFWYNQRWYEYTGTTPEQMEGWGWQSVNDPDVLPAVLERWRSSIATGQPFEMVFPLRGADGVFRAFLTRVVPVRDQNGNITGWFGTNTDISDQRRAEEALKRQAELLQLSFDGIMVWKLGGGIIESWNLGAERLYGIPEAEALGRVIHDLLATEFPKPWDDIRRDLIAKGSWEGELRHHARDGRQIIVSSRLQLIRGADGIERVLEITRDITERKLVEEALRASEARERAKAAELSAVLDAAPVAIFVSHDAECREIVGSQTAYELLRLPPGSNLSKSAPEAERPANFRAMREGREIQPQDLAMQRAASTGVPVRNCEFDFVYEDGTFRNMLGDAVPLFDESGRPSGAVGAFVDITERKRAEERLRQAQKLESVGLLAGGIAHDFNNLLTGIMGNASLVLERVDAASAERIKEVITGAERAANLTRQLLAYSGKGQFIVRDVDISQAVSELSDLMQFSIPKSVDLALNLQKRLPIVRVDPSQLQQIVMNLVINAGEAIGEGNPGKITVTTSVSDVERSFIDATGQDIAPGRYISIEVTDTGAGIDEETKRRIFDPFYSTKFTGRGLGLAAVAGIARARQGAITVESAAGRGSTFRVLLPAAERGEEQRPAQPEAQVRGVVLVADDEWSVRDFIGAVLSERGYRVLKAADGKDALAIFDREGGEIDAVVIDVVMPVMGASELLPKLKARRPGLGILLTSGYSESEARRLCTAYPGAAFIQKPYTARRIWEAIEDVLRAGRSNQA